MMSAGISPAGGGAATPAPDPDLVCPVCLEVVSDAQETECCNQLFCRQCIDRLIVCSLCRKSPLRYRPNMAVQRMADRAPAACEECGETMERSRMDHHRLACPALGFLACPLPACGERPEIHRLWLHVVSDHLGAVAELSPRVSAKVARRMLGYESHDLDDNLSCAVCLEVVYYAQETLCCKALFCNRCILPLENCCLCRSSPLRYRPNKAVQRIAHKTIVTCVVCARDMASSEYAQHQVRCHPGAAVTCPHPGCGQQLETKRVWRHVVDNHLADAVEQSPEGSLRMVRIMLGFKFAIQDGASKRQAAASSSAGGREATAFRDPCQTLGEGGLACRLGSTGKYYCGRAMPGDFPCTDGYCGPTNGENCPSCQRLDLEARRLPVGYLVNRDGAPARRIDGVGRFMCGRKSECLRRNAACDGWCGPNNGPTCEACQCLDRHAKESYAFLLESE
ncbi:hypothetical protein DFJ73DRAFT_962131 [Zopfochytrium polystomum]|nr:hypothetical protein DFJ73DRAFT_962131 [Zopfochytrium polystomum]